MSSATMEARQAAETNAQALATLTAQVQRITALLMNSSPPAPEAPPLAPAPPPPPHDSPEPRVGTPERYDGDPETCNPFLTNCSLLFSLQPRTFASEQAKVAFTINHLTGRARLWGTAEWESQSPACSSFQLFAEELRKVFGLVAARSETARGLMGMRQGDRTVADYSIDFRTKARQSRWNSEALVDAFLHGLADYIKDGLVSHPVPPTLDGVIGLAIQIDLRFQARRRERRQGPSQRQPIFQTRGGASHSCESPPAEPEPMQLGRASLTPEERDAGRETSVFTAAKLDITD